MDLPKSAEVVSNIAGDQNKLTGLLVAGGRVHYEQYGEKEDQKGYVFKKNHGLQIAIDTSEMKALGVTMEVLLDCVKQLEEMGDAKTIKDKIGFRDHQGYLSNGLVIQSKLDPRLKMSVMYNSSDYEDTDFLLNWFLDNEHLDPEMKKDSPTYKPEREVDADELKAADKAREAAALVEPKGESAPNPNQKIYQVYEKGAYPKRVLGTLKAKDREQAMKKAKRIFFMPGDAPFELVQVTPNGGFVSSTESVIESMLGLSSSNSIQEHVDLLRSDKPEYLNEKHEQHYNGGKLSVEFDKVSNDWMVGEDDDFVSPIAVFDSKEEAEAYVSKLKASKTESKLIKEEYVFISLKPGINVVKLAERLEDRLDIEVEVLKNGINLYTDDRDEVKEAVKLIGKDKIKDIPQFQDMIEAEGIEMNQLSETGEADQDYDKEFYDVIAKALEKKGYQVKHREFDKYQGIYLDISKGGKKLGRYFNTEYYVIGKTKKEPNVKYRSAELVGDEGDTYSADPSDYFQMGANDRFKNSDLLLVHMDGTSETISNPKKSQLPKSSEVQSKTLNYEGDPDHVAVFAKEMSGEDGPVAEVHVSADYKKVDVSELVDLINQSQKAPVESQTLKGNLMENKRPAKVQYEGNFSHPEAGSFESVDFWGLPLSEEDYGKMKPLGQPEYSKTPEQYSAEVNKIRGNQSSNTTDDNTGKHVEAGNALEKPKSTIGTEYGQKDGAKKLKVGDVTKDDGKGDHVDGTGAATDGNQYSKVDAGKVKVGKPGDDHGSHVEEARGSAKKKVMMLHKKKKMEAKKKGMKKEDMDIIETNEPDEHYDTNLKMKSAKPMMGRMGELKSKMEKRHPMNKEAVGSPVGGDKTAKIATVKGSQAVEGKKYQWKPARK